MIRFLTAGNVDDGKSSLIGRLLYDSDSLFEDQIEEVKRSTDESFNGELDFSLFLDGLISERKQRITIDVAYRYFSYDNKKFIIADAPGHEQYTRNMAVAAANSDIIVILVDATKKVKSQTIRHSYIASLFGIKKAIIAVNKMDLVNYSQGVFNEIKEDYLEKTKDLKFEDIDFVPVSSINGENVVKGSENMKWFDGKTILNHLNSENNTVVSNDFDLRILVQNVLKYDNKRLYQGFVSSGKIKVGDQIAIYPSQKYAKVTKIVKSSQEVAKAVVGEAISFELDDEIDLERGGVVTLAQNNDKIILSNKLNANIIWFDEKAFNRKGFSHSDLIIKISHNYLQASIDKLHNVIDLSNVSNDWQSKNDAISLNQIANVDINLSGKIAFDKFSDNKFNGSFLLIDSITNETVACGIINDQAKSGDIDLDFDEKNVDEFLTELSSLIKKHFPKSNLDADSFLKKFLQQY